ncbi:MAG: acyltransferase [Ruminococcus sp.]|nr:acyltransferase [Ruminococcus sp.]
MKITKRTVIYGGCEIRSPWNFTADNCVVSNNCLLDCRNEIKFGQNVVLGAGVHIWTEQHDVNSPTFKVTERNRGPVVVGDRAWICSDTTILPNVNVGEGAVLASRACATKNLEPFGVYAGIPAKKISERNKDLVYELNGKSHWKFY